MAKLKKLINDYGEVIDFNQKLENFLRENENFLRRNNQKQYSSKTLLEAINKPMTISVGIKIQGRITLLEHDDSSTNLVSNGVEIHCLSLDDVDPIAFGFAIHLVIGNNNGYLNFTIAKNREQLFLGDKEKTYFNRRKKMIGDIRRQVIFFSSRQDFNDVLELCQRAVQSFNNELPDEHKLISSANL
jgi:hypothetical protein